MQNFPNNTFSAPCSHLRRLRAWSTKVDAPLQGESYGAKSLFRYVPTLQHVSLACRSWWRRLDSVSGGCCSVGESAVTELVFELPNQEVEILGNSAHVPFIDLTGHDEMDNGPR